MKTPEPVCRILLAEDAIEDQQLLLEALTRDRPNVDVTVVATGSDFRRLYNHGGFDCALLDFHLPDCRADELLDSMKAELGDTPIVVISNRSDQDAAVASIRHGGSDFVAKERALSHQELWVRVEHAIATKQRKEVERRHTERRERYLAQLADTDTLTGLNNRRYLLSCIRAGRWRDGRRMSLGCVMFDLDHFKRINDTFGHHAGDRVLRTVCGTIRTKLHSGDLAIRWGGEEILVVRQSLDLVDLWTWAQGVCREVEGLTINCETNRLNVTVSAGFTVCPEARFDDSVIAQADEALYLAKRLGRNQVCSTDMVRIDKCLDEVTCDDRAAASEMRERFLARILSDLKPTQAEHVTNHCEGVGELAAQIAHRMGLDAAMVRRVGDAGLLHDIGKCAVPEQLLSKTMRLTPAESSIVRRHVAISGWIAARLGLDPQGRSFIEHHHDRYDASPSGHHVGAKPIDSDPSELGAHILCVADAYVTMLSARSYNLPRTPAEAMEELRRHEGTQFDPRVVRAMASEPAVVRQAA